MVCGVCMQTEQLGVTVVDRYLVIMSAYIEIMSKWDSHPQNQYKSEIAFQCSFWVHSAWKLKYHAACWYLSFINCLSSEIRLTAAMKFCVFALLYWRQADNFILWGDIQFTN